VLDDKACRAAALALVARKSWTEQELTSRLRRRGAPASVARAVVADLVTRGSVNDAEFARAWAHARARVRGIGQVRLGRELAARGVAPELARVAIEAAFGEVSERERAGEIGRRRLSGLRGGKVDRVPARLRDYLLRRGFPASLVADVVRELTGVGSRGDPA
jgi:SOS response regulatory protein OraA/RecX